MIRKISLFKVTLTVLYIFFHTILFWMIVNKYSKYMMLEN